jgi:hypothetical protein
MLLFQHIFGLVVVTTPKLSQEKGKRRSRLGSRLGLFGARTIVGTWELILGIALWRNAM